MSDRFDLEQQIFECWKIIDDIKLLDKNVLEGKIEGGSLTQDEISNYLLGLETIYELKFEQLFATFGDLIKNKQI
jgi:hypothetical protein